MCSTPETKKEKKKKFKKEQHKQAIALLRRLVSAVANGEDTQAVLAIGNEAENLLKEHDAGGKPHDKEDYPRIYEISDKITFETPAGPVSVIKGSRISLKPSALTKLGFSIEKEI